MSRAKLPRRQHINVFVRIRFWAFLPVPPQARLHTGYLARQLPEVWRHTSLNSFIRTENENWIFDLLQLFFRSFDLRFGFFTTFYVGNDHLLIIFTHLQLFHIVWSGCHRQSKSKFRSIGLNKGKSSKTVRGSLDTFHLRPLKLSREISQIR
jgi:hypothetical protein